MSEWVESEDKKAYYIFVDGKPGEDVRGNLEEDIYCMAFVGTIGNTTGVKIADFDWLKQYKESKSLTESRDIVQNLLSEIKSENFPDLNVWVMSASYEFIKRNGMIILEGMEREIDDFSLSSNKVTFGSKSLPQSKAQVLVWYNYWLCSMAPQLVEKAHLYGLTRGIFVIDRLGDNDDTVMDFMELITKQSSMKVLWNKAENDYEKKLDRLGFQFINRRDDDGNILGPNGTMQFCLTDWMTQAAYAHKNPGGNRDPQFESDLNQLLEYLIKIKSFKIFEYTGDIAWP